MANKDPNDLARTAKASASSSTATDGPENAINGLIRPMDDDMEMWIKIEQNWFNQQTMLQWITGFERQKTVNSGYLRKLGIKTRRRVR